jgi:hypothetical protein
MLRTFGLIAGLALLLLPGTAQASLLVLKPPGAVSQHDWLGVWLHGHDVIWVTRNPDDTLSIVGAAYSAGDEGHVMQASLDFEVAWAEGRNTLAGGAGTCGARLVNMRHYLLVRDNGGCGGARFDGLYAHQ